MGQSSGKISVNSIPTINNINNDDFEFISVFDYKIKDDIVYYGLKFKENNNGLDRYFSLWLRFSEIRDIFYDYISNYLISKQIPVTFPSRKDAWSVSDTKDSIAIQRIYKLQEYLSFVINKCQEVCHFPRVKDILSGKRRTPWYEETNQDRGKAPILSNHEGYVLCRNDKSLQWMDCHVSISSDGILSIKKQESLQTWNRLIPPVATSSRLRSSQSAYVQEVFIVKDLDLKKDVFVKKLIFASRNTYIIRIDVLLNEPPILPKSYHLWVDSATVADEWFNVFSQHSLHYPPRLFGFASPWQSFVLKKTDSIESILSWFLGSNCNNMKHGMDVVKPEHQYYVLSLYQLDKFEDVIEIEDMMYELQDILFFNFCLGFTTASICDSTELCHDAKHDTKNDRCSSLQLCCRFLYGSTEIGIEQMREIHNGIKNSRQFIKKGIEDMTLAELKKWLVCNGADSKGTQAQLQARVTILRNLFENIIEEFRLDYFPSMHDFDWIDALESFNTALLAASKSNSIVSSDRMRLDSRITVSGPFIPLTSLNSFLCNDTAQLIKCIVQILKINGKKIDFVSVSMLDHLNTVIRDCLIMENRQSWFNMYQMNLLFPRLQFGLRDIRLVLSGNKQSNVFCRHVAALCAMPTRVNSFSDIKYETPEFVETLFMQYLELIFPTYEENISYFSLDQIRLLLAYDDKLELTPKMWNNVFNKTGICLNASNDEVPNLNSSLKSDPIACNRSVFLMQQNKLKEELARQSIALSTFFESTRIKPEVLGKEFHCRANAPSNIVETTRTLSGHVGVEFLEVGLRSDSYYRWPSKECFPVSPYWDRQRRWYDSNKCRIVDSSNIEIDIERAARSNDGDAMTLDQLLESAPSKLICRPKQLILNITLDSLPIIITINLSNASTGAYYSIVSGDPAWKSLNTSFDDVNRDGTVFGSMRRYALFYRITSADDCTEKFMKELKEKGGVIKESAKDLNVLISNCRSIEPNTEFKKYFNVYTDYVLSRQLTLDLFENLKKNWQEKLVDYASDNNRGYDILSTIFFPDKDKNQTQVAVIDELTMSQCDYILKSLNEKFLTLNFAELTAIHEERRWDSLAKSSRRKLVRFGFSLQLDVVVTQRMLRKCVESSLPCLISGNEIVLSSISLLDDECRKRIYVSKDFRKHYDGTITYYTDGHWLLKIFERCKTLLFKTDQETLMQRLKKCFLDFRKTNPMQPTQVRDKDPNFCTKVADMESNLDRITSFESMMNSAERCVIIQCSDTCFMETFFKKLEKNNNNLSYCIIDCKSKSRWDLEDALYRSWSGQSEVVVILKYSDCLSYDIYNSLVQIVFKSKSLFLVSWVTNKPVMACKNANNIRCIAMRPSLLKLVDSNHLKDEQTAYWRVLRYIFGSKCGSSILLKLYEKDPKPSQTLLAHSIAWEIDIPECIVLYVLTLLDDISTPYPDISENSNPSAPFALGHAFNSVAPISLDCNKLQLLFKSIVKQIRNYVYNNDTIDILFEDFVSEHNQIMHFMSQESRVFAYLNLLDIQTLGIFISPWSFNIGGFDSHRLISYFIPAFEFLKKDMDPDNIYYQALDKGINPSYILKNFDVSYHSSAFDIICSRIKTGSSEDWGDYGDFLRNTLSFTEFLKILDVVEYRLKFMCGMDPRALSETLNSVTEKFLCPSLLEKLEYDVLDESIKYWLQCNDISDQNDIEKWDRLCIVVHIIRWHLIRLNVKPSVFFLEDADLKVIVALRCKIVQNTAESKEKVLRLLCPHDSPIDLFINQKELGDSLSCILKSPIGFLNDGENLGAAFMEFLYENKSCEYGDSSIIMFLQWIDSTNCRFFRVCNSNLTLCKEDTLIWGMFRRLTPLAVLNLCDKIKSPETLKDVFYLIRNIYFTDATDKSIFLDILKSMENKFKDRLSFKTVLTIYDIFIDQIDSLLEFCKGNGICHIHACLLARKSNSLHPVIHILDKLDFDYDTSEAFTCIILNTYSDNNIDYQGLLSNEIDFKDRANNKIDEIMTICKTETFRHCLATLLSDASRKDDSRRSLLLDNRFLMFLSWALSPTQNFLELPKSDEELFLLFTLSRHPKIKSTEQLGNIVENPFVHPLALFLFEPDFLSSTTFNMYELTFPKFKNKREKAVRQRDLKSVIVTDQSIYERNGLRNDHEYIQYSLSFYISPLPLSILETIDEACRNQYFKYNNSKNNITDNDINDIEALIYYEMSIQINVSSGFSYDAVKTNLNALCRLPQCKFLSGAGTVDSLGSTAILLGRQLLLWFISGGVSFERLKYWLTNYCPSIPNIYDNIIKLCLKTEIRDLHKQLSFYPLPSFLDVSPVHSKTGKRLFGITLLEIDFTIISFRFLLQSLDRSVPKEFEDYVTNKLSPEIVIMNQTSIIHDIFCSIYFGLAEVSGDVYGRVIHTKLQPDVSIKVLTDWLSPFVEMIFFIRSSLLEKNNEDKIINNFIEGLFRGLLHNTRPTATESCLLFQSFIGRIGIGGDINDEIIKLIWKQFCKHELYVAEQSVNEIRWASEIVFRSSIQVPTSNVTHKLEKKHLDTGIEKYLDSKFIEDCEKEYGAEFKPLTVCQTNVNDSSDIKNDSQTVTSGLHFNDDESSSSSFTFLEIGNVSGSSKSNLKEMLLSDEGNGDNSVEDDEGTSTHKVYLIRVDELLSLEPADTYWELRLKQGRWAFEEKNNEIDYLVENCHVRVVRSINHDESDRNKSSNSSVNYFDDSEQLWNDIQKIPHGKSVLIGAGFILTPTERNGWKLLFMNYDHVLHKIAKMSSIEPGAIIYINQPPVLSNIKTLDPSMNQEGILFIDHLLLLSNMINFRQKENILIILKELIKLPLKLMKKGVIKKRNKSQPVLFRETLYILQQLASDIFDTLVSAKLYGEAGLNHQRVLKIIKDCITNYKDLSNRDEFIQEFNGLLAATNSVRLSSGDYNALKIIFNGCVNKSKWYFSCLTESVKTINKFRNSNTINRIEEELKKIESEYANILSTDFLNPFAILEKSSTTYTSNNVLSIFGSPTLFHLISYSNTTVFSSKSHRLGNVVTLGNLIYNPFSLNLIKSNSMQRSPALSEISQKQQEDYWEWITQVLSSPMNAEDKDLLIACPYENSFTTKQTDPENRIIGSCLADIAPNDLCPSTSTKSIREWTKQTFSLRSQAENKFFSRKDGYGVYCISSRHVDEIKDSHPFVSVFEGVSPEGMRSRSIEQTFFEIIKYSNNKRGWAVIINCFKNHDNQSTPEDMDRLIKWIMEYSKQHCWSFFYFVDLPYSNLLPENRDRLNFIVEDKDCFKPAVSIEKKKTTRKIRLVFENHKTKENLTEDLLTEIFPRDTASPATLGEWQREVLKFLNPKEFKSKNDVLLLVSAPGAGKTYLINLISKSLLNNRSKSSSYNINDESDIDSLGFISRVNGESNDNQISKTVQEWGMMSTIHIDGSSDVLTRNSLTNLIDLELGLINSTDTNPVLLVIDEFHFISPDTALEFFDWLELKRQPSRKLKICLIANRKRQIEDELKKKGKINLILDSRLSYETAIRILKQQPVFVEMLKLKAVKTQNSKSQESEPDYERYFRILFLMKMFILSMRLICGDSCLSLRSIKDIAEKLRDVVVLKPSSALLSDREYKKMIDIFKGAIGKKEPELDAGFIDKWLTVLIHCFFSRENKALDNISDVKSFFETSDCKMFPMLCHSYIIQCDNKRVSLRPENNSGIYIIVLSSFLDVEGQLCSFSDYISYIPNYTKWHPALRLASWIQYLQLNAGIIIDYNLTSLQQLNIIDQSTFPYIEVHASSERQSLKEVYARTEDGDFNDLKWLKSLLDRQKSVVWLSSERNLLCVQTSWSSKFLERPEPLLDLIAVAPSAEMVLAAVHPRNLSMLINCSLKGDDLSNRVIQCLNDVTFQNLKDNGQMDETTVFFNAAWRFLRMVPLNYLKVLVQGYENVHRTNIKNMICNVQYFPIPSTMPASIGTINDPSWDLKSFWFNVLLSPLLQFFITWISKYGDRCHQCLDHKDERLSLIVKIVVIETTRITVIYDTNFKIKDLEYDKISQWWSTSIFASSLKVGVDEGIPFDIVYKIAETNCKSSYIKRFPPIIRLLSRLSSGSASVQDLQRLEQYSDFWKEFRTRHSEVPVDKIYIPTAAAHYLLSMKNTLPIFWQKLILGCEDLDIPNIICESGIEIERLAERFDSSLRQTDNWDSIKIRNTKFRQCLKIKYDSIHLNSNRDVAIPNSSNNISDRTSKRKSFLMRNASKYSATDRIQILNYYNVFCADVDPSYLDKNHNPDGTEHDLGKNVFQKFTVLIGNFLERAKKTESIDLGPVKECLKRKGFAVEEINDEDEFISHLQKWKDGKYQVTWILSSDAKDWALRRKRKGLRPPSTSDWKKFVETCLSFNLSGGGLFIFGDNEPYMEHIKVLLPHLTGNTATDKKFDGRQNIKRNSDSNRIDAGTFRTGTLITTGLNVIYEGETVCTFDSECDKSKLLLTKRLLTLGLGNKTDKNNKNLLGGGQPILAFSDTLPNETRGRIIADSGCTKLWKEWEKTEGTQRYILNGTVWLLGLDVRLRRMNEGPSYPLYGPIPFSHSRLIDIPLHYTPDPYDFRLVVSFILDSSGSVLYSDWVLMLSFVENFCKELLNKDYKDKSFQIRICIIQFATTARICLHPTDQISQITTTLKEMKEADAKTKCEGYTSFDAAFTQVDEVIEGITKDRDQSIRHIIILQTDGVPTDTNGLLLHVDNAWKTENINTIFSKWDTSLLPIQRFCIGVGKNYNKEILEDIAQNEMNVFHVQSYAALVETLTKNLADKIVSLTLPIIHH